MKKLLYLTAVASGISMQANTIPLDGLVGHWTGNGNALDTSLVGNNGSFSGSYAPGAPHGGQAFNLASGKVVIPDNPAYNFQRYDGWSVGFWFNPNGSSLFNAVFLGQDNGSGYRPKWFVDWGYTVFGNNDGFNFHVNDFNQERIFVTSQSAPAATLNGWNQLTITIDNLHSGRVDFYLNGNDIGTAYMGNYVLQPTAPLVLGFAEGFTYNGLMSDVVLYDRVLTADEAKQLAVPDVSSSFLLLSLGTAAIGVARKRISQA